MNKIKMKSKTTLAKYGIQNEMISIIFAKPSYAFANLINLVIRSTRKILAIYGITRIIFKESDYET